MVVDSCQISHYICSKCNTILKESSSSVDFQLSNSSEQCPSCGYQLSETLHVKKKEKEAELQKKPRSQFEVVPIQLQTAYSLNAKLTLDVGETDNNSTAISLSIGDRVCIIGSRRHANLLLTRLWVRALMPQRHGGFESKNIICIDAGNCTNLYQCVNFARQYGMEIRRQVLRSIIISRAFTIYQLAGLIIRKLPKVIEKFKEAKVVVVISDLLKMFVDDPQVKYHEAKYILQEIMKAIEQLPKDILIIVSLYSLANTSNSNSGSNRSRRYDKLILPTFSKRIAITENERRKGLLQQHQSLLQLKLFKNKQMLLESSISDTKLLVVPTAR